MHKMQNRSNHTADTTWLVKATLAQRTRGFPQAPIHTTAGRRGTSRTWSRSLPSCSADKRLMAALIGGKPPASAPAGTCSSTTILHSDSSRSKLKRSVVMRCGAGAARRSKDQLGLLWTRGVKQGESCHYGGSGLDHQISWAALRSRSPQEDFTQNQWCPVSFSRARNVGSDSL